MWLPCVVKLCNFAVAAHPLPPLASTARVTSPSRRHTTCGGRAPGSSTLLYLTHPHPHPPALSSRIAQHCRTSGIPGMSRSLNRTSFGFHHSSGGHRSSPYNQYLETCTISGCVCVLLSSGSSSIAAAAVVCSLSQPCPALQHPTSSQHQAQKQCVCSSTRLPLPCAHAATPHPAVALRAPRRHGLLSRPAAAAAAAALAAPKWRSHTASRYGTCCSSSTQQVRARSWGRGVCWHACPAPWLGQSGRASSMLACTRHHVWFQAAQQWGWRAAPRALCRTNGEAARATPAAAAHTAHAHAAATLKPQKPCNPLPPCH
jgi:hypothetical protein